MFVNAGLHTITYQYQSGDFLSDIADAITEDDHGAILSLEVSAGSKKDKFPAGYNEWRHSVQCRISAPPVGGKANKAISACIASKLNISKSKVSILSGATSSSKRVHIAGMSRDLLIEKIRSLQESGDS